MDSRQGEEQDRLGGRLPLLAPADLSEAQRELYERVLATRVAAARRAGYTAALPDGRLVGPFNALVRTPRLGAGMLGWAQAVAESLGDAGVDPTVREGAILTVAASRGSDYVLYAHTAAARHAGLAPAVVEAVLDLREPTGPPDVTVAYRLARCLAEGRPVGEDTYTAAVAAFGLPGLVALVCLVGQYLTTCAVLSCFDVPAPRTP